MSDAHQRHTPRPLDLRALRGVLGLSVVLGALYVSAGMLEGQPLDWDDAVWLTDPLLQQPALDAVGTAFTTLRDRAWYPLLRLSWWLQGTLAPQPFAAHLVNLVAFCACIPLVGAVLARLGASRFVVFGATTLWALHPTRVESVAWLTSRKDVVSLLLVLVTTHLVLSERHRVAVLTFAVACLFKAAVFPVAAVLAVMQWARGRRDPESVGLGLVAVGLAIASIGWVAFHWSDAGLGTARADWPFDGVAPNLAFAVGLQAHWGASLLVPTGLAAIYPVPASPWLMGVAGTGILAVLGILAWRTGRWGTVLFALWLLPLLPVHGLVAMPFWGADRHLLLPSLAASVALCLGLERAQQRFGWSGVVRSGLVGLLALGAAWGTVQRVPDWHDTLTLWEADAHRPGQHWVRGLHYGTALGAAGRFDEAVVAFRAAEEVVPDGRESRSRVLARRIIAQLAADGWTRQDAAITQRLEPPPLDAEGWMVAAEVLSGEQRCDAFDQAARFDGEVAGDRAAACRR